MPAKVNGLFLDRAKKDGYARCAFAVRVFHDDISLVGSYPKCKARSHLKS